MEEAGASGWVVIREPPGSQGCPPGSEPTPGWTRGLSLSLLDWETGAHSGLDMGTGDEGGLDRISGDEGERRGGQLVSRGRITERS